MNAKKAKALRRQKRAQQQQQGVEATAIKVSCSNFTVGQEWAPDLTTPEGINEAITILGKPMVDSLMGDKPKEAGMIEIVSVDPVTKIVTFRQVK